MSDGLYRHADEVDGSIRSARCVIPEILALLGPVTSVIDVGGGTGSWLREFVSLGVSDVHLIDCEAVRSGLLINSSRFTAANLATELPPVIKADLAMSLECAEHLPKKRSMALVKWLTESADRVVFSAAVPGQGGKGHINEQHHEYWHALFNECGFEIRDVLRGRLVKNEDVAWWYRQNLFVYVKPGTKLMVDDPAFLPAEFTLSHRQLHQPSIRAAFKILVAAFRTSLARRFGRK
jgi:hypothetical protein